MQRWLVIGLLVILLVFILALPFIWHTTVFIVRLRSNEEKWAKYGSSNYEIVVVSNSLANATGGTNHLRIEAGRIVEGHNPDCGLCAPSDFSQLTIDALFARIWQECLQGGPLGLSIPICNVDYDQALGFPRRLDTYTFTQEGTHQPSITVERVSLDP
jgi:hypothetical protein